MSRETEKVMKAAQEFLEKNANSQMSEKELNDLMSKFVNQYNSDIPGKITKDNASTADDYIILAEDAMYEDKASVAFNYASKALKLEPDNLDAERLMIESGADGFRNYLKKLERAVKHGDEVMKKEGYMDEDSIGNFWGILETRPYMRLRHSYMDTLYNGGMLKKAMHECEELIRLNENDNLGARYILMHLYVLFEDEEKAIDLHKKYDEYDETQMLLPLSVLYFKQGDWDKAEKYLARLIKVNKDTKKFIRAVIEDDLDRYSDQMSDFGYRLFSMEELVMEYIDNSVLFGTVPGFFIWADELNRKKKK